VSASRAADAAGTAVRAALAAHTSTRSLAEAALEPVRGGLSNHAWQAEQGEQRYFVRLGGPESATLGVDRESERTLLAIVAAAGLAPPLVACDPSNGLLVTQYVAGGPWRREDAHEARNIERIADRLRRLHGLEPASGIRTIDFAAQARSLETQLGTLAPLGTVRVVAAAVRRVADPAFELLASRRPRLVPCHNDLHHLNLLDDGSRLWIVDWEYGGVGDPLFDLASYACQHEFTGDERATLLDAYAAGSAIEAPALDAACAAFDYVQWLWYSICAVRHPHAGREYALRAAALEARLAASGS
jgi:thiamine kinase-like enzyme